MRFPGVPRQMLTLLLVAVIPAAAAALFHPRRPDWQSAEIPAAMARSWGDKVMWIDARSVAEYQRDHIPGALPLNEEAWDQLVPAVLDAFDPEKIVVVYCSSLSCAASHDVARRLREEVGLPEVRVLQGGWEAWLRARK